MRKYTKFTKLSAVFFILLAMHAASAQPNPEPVDIPVPVWNASGVNVNQDGIITLAWDFEPESEFSATYYELRETSDSTETIIRVDAAGVRLQRHRAGTYNYAVKACLWAGPQVHQCGSESPVRGVEVSQQVFAEASAKHAGAAAGSPAQGRSLDAKKFPAGMFQSSVNQYSGWSLYQADPLDYGKSSTHFGHTFELSAYWTTFRSIDGSWQPVWLRAQLYPQGEDQYSGNLVYVNRPETVEDTDLCRSNGINQCETIIGAIEVDTSNGLSDPVIRWRSEVIGFYADPSSVGSVVEDQPDFRGVEQNRKFNLSTASEGIWQPVIDSQPTDDLLVIYWNEKNSSSELLLFHDQEAGGNPVWAFARDKNNNRGRKQARSCVKVLQSGAPADGASQQPLRLASDAAIAPNCQSNGNTQTGNYGRIFFEQDTGSQVQTGQGWFSLNNLASRKLNISVGQSALPQPLVKTTQKHDVRFSYLNNCDLSLAACRLGVMWFTQGDYPQASVYLSNLSTAEKTLVSTQPRARGHLLEISAAAAYQLQLESSADGDGVVLAKSRPFHVRTPQTEAATATTQTQIKSGLAQKLSTGSTQTIFYDPITSTTNNGWVYDPDGTDDVIGTPFSYNKGPLEVDQFIRDGYYQGVYYQASSGINDDYGLVTLGGGDIGSINVNRNDLDGTSSLESPTIQIPTGSHYSSPVLRFFYFVGAYYKHYNDFIKVQVSAGGTVDTLWQYSVPAAQTPATWTEQTVDLSAYAGQSVKLRFLAQDGYSGSSLSPQYDNFVFEVGFDEIKVETVYSNTAPVIVNPGNQTNTEEDPVSLAITASDADGDSLNYSAAGLPPGLSIHSNSGLISGTLAVVSEGVYNVTVTVDDGESSDNIATAAFTWTVENRNLAPSINPIADRVDFETQSVSIQVSATDPEGEALTYSTSPALPAGISINPSSGLISGSLSNGSADEYNITVIADDLELQASTTFNWVVHPFVPPAAPVLAAPVWVHQASQLYRLDWTHADTTAVTYYELDEIQPDGSLVSHNVNPGSTLQKSFDRSQGPFGWFTYSLRACNPAGCSANAADTRYILVHDPNAIGGQTYNDYYILSPIYFSTGATLMSYEDNNTIVVADVAYSLDKDELLTIPAGVLTQGTHLYGSASFEVGVSALSVDIPAPAIFASHDFVVPHYRDEHGYLLLSPYGDASVDITLGGSTETVSLTQGEVVEYDAGSNNSVAGIIHADQPILVKHYSTTSGINDAYVVPPPADSVWGFRSTHTRYAALEDGTFVQVLSSGGQMKQFSIDAGESASIAVGSNASHGKGAALALFANKPITAMNAADGDGGEATGFWQKKYHTTRFGIPVNSQYIAVACPETSTTLTLTKPDLSTETQSCDADSDHPGKVRFGANISNTIPAGSVLEATAPVFAIYETNSNAETNLLGNQADPADGRINVAIYGTATQSSTANNGAAGRAIDGNTDGKFSAGSVTRTDIEDEAWWHLQLSQNQYIGALSIWDRTDACCDDQNQFFYILVSDVPFVSTDLTASINQPGVSSYFYSGVLPEKEHFAINRTGEFIRIQTADRGQLGLAEVQVWRDTNIPATFIPPGQQSSVTGDYVELQMIVKDGEDDVLTFSATSLPTGLSLDPNSGLISGTIVTVAAPEVVPVTVTLEDQNGRQSSTAFNWTIDGPPLAPGKPNSIWIDHPNQDYEIHWTHSDESYVDHYILKEILPDESEVSYQVSPGTLTLMAFDKTGGPYGNYRYQVQACNQWGCSAYGEFNLLPVVDPDVHGGQAYFDYYILSPEFVNTEAAIISYEDNNVIDVGDYQFLLNQYETATVPVGALTQGTYVYGSAPFELLGVSGTRDIPVPAAFASTELVIPHFRYDHYYYLLSPYSDAQVNITIDGVTDSITLSKGQVLEYFAGSVDTVSGVIQSDVPILAKHISRNLDSDGFAVPPPAKAIWGFRTTRGYIGVLEDNTSIQIFASSGQSEELVANSGDFITANVGSNGSHGNGAALAIFADKPIAAIQSGDGDGNESTAFWAAEFHADRFALPVDGTYLAVSCPEDATLTLTKPDLSQETLSCDANGSHPGKARFGANSGNNLPAGSVMVASKPVMVFLERTDSLETNLWGGQDDPADGRVNVAVNGVATQSSTGFSAPASRAIDGNTNGAQSQNSLAITDKEDQPWWQVDLGTAEFIDVISIWDRTDACCTDRLYSFYLLVSDNPFTSDDLTAAINQPGVSSYHYPGAIGEVEHFAINRSGRYIRIQFPTFGALAIAEVQAWVNQNGNHPPTIADPGAQTHLVGDALTLPLNINDVDGDTLTVQVDGLPDGLSYSVASKEISGTLTPDAAGNHTVTVTVADSDTSTVLTIPWTVNSNISFNFSGTPLSFDESGTVTLSWDNIANVNGCDASGTVAAWNSTAISMPSGQKQINLSTPGSYDFVLSCFDAASTQSETVTVTVNDLLPVIDSFTVTPGTINEGQSATLTWASSNATSCVASGDWSGNKSLNGNEVVIPATPGVKTYTLTCDDVTTQVNSSVSLTVIDLLPVIDSFTVTPGTINEGQSATLTWASSNATSCVASGDWAGGKSMDGNEVVIPATPGAKTYTLTCDDVTTQVYSSVSLTVIDLLPVIDSFTATPATIDEGQSVTLSWQTTNATSCNASGHWSGSKSVDGNQVINLNTPGVRNYTLSCDDGTTTVTETVSVTVNDLVPVIDSFTVSPAAIIIGESITLSWASTHATSCSASGDWSGSKALDGSEVITPASHGSKTYYLTCTDNITNRVASESVTVQDINVAINSFTASATSVEVGSSVSFNWDVYNAEFCTPSGGAGGWSSTSISNATGNLPVGGQSISFNVENSFTFNLECNNGLSGGNERTVTADSITVNAYVPFPASNPANAPGAASKPTTTTDPDYASSSVVGATVGEFRVDESGSATYSVPILTAPGSGGVAPQMAISYSSQGGNGPLGMGWNISGLSVISRCAQTLEQDGATAVRGITLTASDRFCLDGQRLLLVSPTGSYGDDGTEYRTEIDGIAKITAHGAAGNGPSYFTVQRKDGSTSHYGNTADSRIEANTAADTDTVFAWAQNRFQDSAGSYIDYIYTEETGGAVEFVIDKIDYTANDSSSTSHFAELDFVYDTGRTDQTLSYLAGADFQSTRRLIRIDSKAKAKSTDSDKAWLRSYHLSYGTDGHGRSNLESIEECNNSSKTYCFAPTTFTWLDSSAKPKGVPGSHNSADYIEYFPSPTSPFPGGYLFGQAGDVNGDGRSDYVFVHESNGKQLAYTLSNGSGFNQHVNIIELPDGVIPEAGSTDESVWALIDFDGDGMLDVIYPNASNQWVGHRWTGSGFGLAQVLGTIVSNTPTPEDLPSMVRVMDFDGDGRADLLYAKRGVLYFNGHSGTTQTPFSAPAAMTQNTPVTITWPNDSGEVLRRRGPFVKGHNNIKVFDYNGDGAVDIALQVTAQYCANPTYGFENGCRDDEFLPQTEGNELLESQATVDTHGYAYGDSCDIWGGAQQGSTNERCETGAQTQGPSGQNFVKDYSAWHVFLSDGENNFADDEVVLAGSGCDISYFSDCVGLEKVELENIFLSDFNADGLADLLYKREGKTNQWFYEINSGAGLINKTDISSQIGLTDSELADHVETLDYNGDGYNDILFPPKIENGETMDVLLWRGDDFASLSETTSVLVDDPVKDGDQHGYADVNGDGKLDALFFSRNSQGEYSSAQVKFGFNKYTESQHPAGVKAPPAEAANVITKISNGFGAVTDISYTPLTETGTYSRMQDAGAAVWGQGGVVYDLIAPNYVVSKVSSSAPTYASGSAKSSVEYAYVGAKIQAGGRGFLGFGEVISFDPQSCVRTNTLYRQDFPYIGSPVETWQVLIDTANCQTSSLRLAPISDPGTSSLPDWDVSITRDTKPMDLLGGSEDVLAYALNQWDSINTTGGAQFPYIKRSIERSYTLAENFSHKVLTINCHPTDSNRCYDDYGNARYTEVKTYQQDADEETYASRVVTDNSYNNDTSKWHLGRLTQSTVSHQRSGLGGSVVRSSSFAYDSATGILIRQTVEPNSTTHKVDTTYTLDGFGNRLTTTVTGVGMSGRTSSMSYDSLGRFPVQTKNAFNQVTQDISDWDQFGNPEDATNINGVLTESFYDGMGRPYVTYSATGAHSKALNYTGPGSHCPTGTAYHVKRSGGGSPDQYECFDKIGRAVRSATEGFSGAFIYTDTYYDANGRVERVSEPYYSGDSRYWNVSEYDEVGRVLQQQLTDNAGAVIKDSGNKNYEQFYSYDESASNGCGVTAGALMVVMTNGLGQDRLELKNALGENTAVYDEACNAVTYSYDHVGNLTAVTGADGETVSMTYDSLKLFKTAMTDPDKGNWSYVYNALGELEVQTDAKGEKTEFDYDSLGRVIERRDINSSGITIANGRWEYENGASATQSHRGQLLTETLYSGAGTGTILHQRSYLYDSYGRVEIVTTQIDGSSYAEESTYDEYGRVFQQFDASGDDWGQQFIYNGQGYLDQIKEARDQVNGTIYQDIVSMDARGNVTQMYLGGGSADHAVDAHATYENSSGLLLRLEAYDGNGVKLQYNEYDFDALGNLLQRHDQSGSKDLKEDFSYDALNRLSTVKLTAPGFGLSSFQTLSLSYNDAGNITHKSDVGTYSYGAGNAGPHAVTSAGGQTYTYDANGNMISGDGRSISYTIFDKASQITQGGNTVDFYYDMNRNRYQRVEGSKTTTYVGNVEIIDTPIELEYRRSIAGVAIQHLFPNSQTYREEYLLKDHLGSIDIITDESGEVITDGFLNPIGELSFDAFGQRRQASDWRLTIQGSNPVPQSTTRGYTGHEMVDSVNVIHMNGRIYDPKLGRFMQADPHVQAPENAQNLNRYSYVLNNPLSYTDPSGFIFKKLVRGLFKIAPFGLLGYLATKNPLLNAIAQTVACIAGGPVGCGAYAAYSTYLNTGSLGQALKSGLIAGVTAYAFQQIGGADLGGTERVLAHGFVGGVSAELQGGKFGHGFASAGLTKIFTVKTGNWLSKQHTLTGATIAAAVGGTISQATGGKFANGAATAAMGYVYNQVGGRSNKLSRDQAKARLHNFADVTVLAVDAGQITSAEALARIYEFGATVYGQTQFNSYDQKSLLVTDLGDLLAGINRFAIPHNNGHVGQLSFTDSGFAPQFQDGSNQVQHFTAGFVAGAMYGGFARASHRWLRPDTAPDTALNDTSSSLGARFTNRNPTIPMRNLGQSIRVEICGNIQQGVCM